MLVIVQIRLNLLEHQRQTTGNSEHLTFFAAASNIFLNLARELKKIRFLVPGKGSLSLMKAVFFLNSAFWTHSSY